MNLRTLTPNGQTCEIQSVKIRHYSVVQFVLQLSLSASLQSFFPPHTSTVPIATYFTSKDAVWSRHSVNCQKFKVIASRGESATPY